MSTITVPLTPELDNFIKERTQDGFSSKAELVRQALNFYREELEIKEIMQARQEVKESKVFKGNLRQIAKKFK